MAAAAASKLCSQVELFLSCANLPKLDRMSNTDAFVVVYLSGPGGAAGREIGRTEIVKDSTSPEFTTQFKLDYHFEEVQNLRFDVYDSGEQRPREANGRLRTCRHPCPARWCARLEQRRPIEARLRGNVPNHVGSHYGQPRRGASVRPRLARRRVRLTARPPTQVTLALSARGGGRAQGELNIRAEERNPT